MMNKKGRFEGQEIPIAVAILVFLLIGLHIVGIIGKQFGLITPSVGPIILIATIAIILIATIASLRARASLSGRDIFLLFAVVGVLLYVLISVRTLVPEIFQSAVQSIGQSIFGR